jgi:hypothetical protein
MDDDEDERGLIMASIKAQIRRDGLDPDTEAVLIPAQVMADWVSQATREKMPTNKS